MEQEKNRRRERERGRAEERKRAGAMKSFELAVNIERVIRSLKNTWTIIKPAWGALP